MKRIFVLILAAALLLAGCSKSAPEDTVATVSPDNAPAETVAAPQSFSSTMDYEEAQLPFASRFDAETTVVLSDEGISVNGGSETDAVFTSRDIIYYEDKDAYESGNPYGDGDAADKHTAEEAAAHTVVNITAPGSYRISGKLSAGQIRVDLGDHAYYDETAVVELILEDADITCTVAPAILFLNVYECDGNWSTDTAQADVDTSAAGANLILEGRNTVSGSYVAKIYKDKEGEKKLWKQDGAVYSYMSMNVFGPGSLDLTAANEGMDTELHLTINGGDIAIRSGNDGINTNEDGVSVTTINGGNLHIIAGLGAEGDGIDSNGYLVINGGTVVSSAHPAADAGLDSDLGSFVHGGTVIALGSTMDWAESESGQATMNLQFASQQSSGSAIVISKADGTIVFAYDPSEDEILAENLRTYQGAVISCPGLQVGESYLVYLDGTLDGTDKGGIFSSVSSYTSGVQMQYTGTDLGGFGGMGFPGGFGGGKDRPDDFGGQMPGGFSGGIPEDFAGFEGQMPGGFNGEIPEDFTGFGGQMPGGFSGEIPEDFAGFDGNMPEGFDGEMPEGFDRGQMPGGSFPQGGRGQGGQPTGEANTVFYLADKVNAFSGVTAVK